MKRRYFISLTTSGSAALSVVPESLATGVNAQSKVRLGETVFENWIKSLPAKET